MSRRGKKEREKKHRLQILRKREVANKTISPKDKGNSEGEKEKGGWATAVAGAEKVFKVRRGRRGRRDGTGGEQNSVPDPEH